MPNVTIQVSDTDFRLLTREKGVGDGVMLSVGLKRVSAKIVALQNPPQQRPDACSEDGAMFVG